MKTVQSVRNYSDNTIKLIDSFYNGLK